MKKGKLIVTITIGLMCLILTMIIFMQVKTISQTDISELEIMRESELKTELTALKTKNEEIVTKLEETNSKILEYQVAINDGYEAAKLQEAELQETKNLIGINEVEGEGVIINLANAGQMTVSAGDLLELVNLLRNAGAEAISINENRVIYSTYIANLNGSNYITIDGTYTSAPYIVKAIGNPTYLESSVSQKKYGYIDTKIADGKQVTLERATSLIIPGYNGDLNFEYVRGEEE